MATRGLRRAAAATAAAAALLVGGAVPAMAAPGDVYGVDINDNLIRFSSAQPGAVTTIGPVTGLANGEDVVGIDFRPANGLLYAVTDSSRVLTVDPATGAGTVVATLTTPIEAPVGELGVDFNPVPDRLRIVTDTGQNLRVDVSTGATTVDGRLSYATGDRFAGQQPTVTGAAYTNPDTNTSTGTQLFYVDPGVGRNSLATTSAPNDGILNTLGALGSNPTDLVGFDIDGGNQALAAFDTGDGNALYRVDTGAGGNESRATLVGPIGYGPSLVDIAVELPAPPAPIIPEAPATAALPLVALGLGVVALLRRRRDAGALAD